MPIVSDIAELRVVLLGTSRDTEHASLAQFQKMLRMVIEVSADETPPSGGSIRFGQPDSRHLHRFWMSGLLPVELLHVENDILQILTGGDFKANRHLEWRLVGHRWSIYAPEKMENGRWNGAAVPTNTGRLVKDEDIIWTEDYPNAAYAYLGSCCAALEAEAQRGEPLADFEKFAIGVRKASPEQLAKGLDKLPDALKGATSVIAPVLKNPQMADVVALQSMLLGNRWRVHGIVQGRSADEWRCTMVWSEDGWDNPGNGLRARSGKCADPVIAFLLAVLKARLIDKGLLRTDQAEAA